jgi:DNA mismatch repair protein MutS
VAQLAGVPQPVIRAARRHLATLEAHSIQPTPQFDLFAQPAGNETENAEELPQAVSLIADALAVIDPDSLSPRQALDELYRLKRLLDK